MRTLLSSLLAVFMLAAATTAGAQELKIGYVNSERLLRDSAPAKAALDKLQAEFNKREKDINEMGARLKTASDRFEKDSPTLSESERIRRQRDLLDQDREFQRKRRELQEDFNQRKYEEQSVLFERANKVIKQIYEKEKYDLIVQEAVFASSRVDITDKVIGALNAQASGK